MPRPRRASRSASRLPATTEPKFYVLEHGYCRSIYAEDPNGMICEFTLDHPDADKINAIRAR